jgi:hypothetical protein
MIRKYDIICLVETKTDDIDIVKLEGYETSRTCMFSSAFLCRRVPRA